MKHYNVTIDYIRAILIMLVILVHIVNFGDLYPDIKYSVLAFFMPAFLILTGYLVNVRKTCIGFSLYILRILLPYVIMVTGFMVFSMYLPVKEGVRDMSLLTVYKVMCITSIGPYWYLRVMIVCGILYYLSFTILRIKNVTTKCCVFASLLILTSELTPYLSLRSAAYYFIGVLVKVYVGDISRVLRGSFWAAVPFALLICNRDFWDWGSLSILACCFLFFSFTTWLSRYFKGRFSAMMRYIGRNTFPIYIFHPIFTMAAKYMLPMFELDHTGLLHTLVTIVMGLAGSLGIAYAMDRCHLSYIFAKKEILR